MQFLTTALFGLVAAALASAGNVEVSNNCTSPVYVQSNSATTPTTIQPGSVYSMPATGTGVSVKVGVTPQLPHPLLIAYTLSNGLVYYDLSTLNGNSFIPQGFHLRPSDTSCHTISCAPGANPCTDTYYPGQPSNHNPVYACQSGSNFVLTTCG
ncbi:MAG: hypothetical protein M1828_006241 [Chrysothrix sp. TS-e1954]|nr:MAG: hypothetical protein M1828_006241 [Chrysothrix sp. TS-e1954]